MDVALGGGYPKGRVVEIYGPESSGKTTLALHAVAEIQRAGGRAAFVDVEHALDPAYAKNLGVNIDELFVCQVRISPCFRLYLVDVTSFLDEFVMLPCSAARYR